MVGSRLGKNPRFCAHLFSDIEYHHCFDPRGNVFKGLQLITLASESPLVCLRFTQISLFGHNYKLILH